ncbi:MAG: hypothetical protein ACREF3_01330 [Acetobacteraceae bacterium]
MGRRAAWIIGALALMAAAAPVTHAEAATISFFKTGLGQPAGASVSGFDIHQPAVIPGGFPFFVLGPTPENVLVGYPAPGLFSTASGDQDNVEALAVMVTPATRDVSDLVVLEFGVSGGQGSVIAGFQAFDPALVGPVSGIPVIVENGHTQNLSGSFFDDSDAQPVTLPEGLVILVSPVPEPDSFIVLAIGVIGAALVRYGWRSGRKRRRDTERRQA